jgi:hypothetical protein
MESLHPKHENWAHILGYINQILLEEENKNGNFEGGALHAIEKSFYDVLGEDHPSLQHSVPRSNQSEAHAICLNEYSDCIHDRVEVDSITALEYKRGIEEGLKFLPSTSNSKLEVDPQAANLIPFQLNNHVCLV